jgi:hypothetical protein
MWNISIREILVLSLVTAGALALPEAVCAQDAQQDETDQQFASRMTNRLAFTQTRIEQLTETVDRTRNQTMGRTTPSVYSSPQSGGLMGSPNRAGGAGVDDNRRTNLQLRSLEKKVEKERKRLQAPQGSQSRTGKLNRKSVNSNVFRIERKLDEPDRNLRRR